VDRGVSRGQRGGSLTVVNLSFLDRRRNISRNKLIGERGRKEYEIGEEETGRRRKGGGR
jgi:hypothetical protein